KTILPVFERRAKYLECLFLIIKSPELARIDADDISGCDAQSLTDGTPIVFVECELIDVDDTGKYDHARWLYPLGKELVPVGFGNRHQCERTLAYRFLKLTLNNKLEACLSPRVGLHHVL